MRVTVTLTLFILLTSNFLLQALILKRLAPCSFRSISQTSINNDRSSKQWQFQSTPQPDADPDNIMEFDRSALVMADRIESGKCAALSLIGGSLLPLPISLSFGYFVDHFSPQWEFSNDLLAVSLLLFGLVYRYATRDSAAGGTGDPQQIRNGVIAAFALTRAFAAVDVPVELCTSLPLDCGPPFHYFTITMVLQGLTILIESAVAYGASAATIDFAVSKGWLKK